MPVGISHGLAGVGPQGIDTLDAEPISPNIRRSEEHNSELKKLLNTFHASTERRLKTEQAKRASKEAP
jgi:hypothetical protein